MDKAFKPDEKKEKISLSKLDACMKEENIVSEYEKYAQNYAHDPVITKSVLDTEPLPILQDEVGKDLLFEVKVTVESGWQENVYNNRLNEILFSLDEGIGETYRNRNSLVFQRDLMSFGEKMIPIVYMRHRMTTTTKLEGLDGSDFLRYAEKYLKTLKNNGLLKEDFLVGEATEPALMYWLKKNGYEYLHASGEAVYREMREQPNNFAPIILDLSDATPIDQKATTYIRKEMLDEPFIQVRMSTDETGRQILSLSPGEFETATNNFLSRVRFFKPL